MNPASALAVSARGNELGYTEIENLVDTSLAIVMHTHEAIHWLQLAMHGPGRVRFSERKRRLVEAPKRLLPGKPLREPLRTFATKYEAPRYFAAHE